MYECIIGVGATGGGGGGGGGATSNFIKIVNLPITSTSQQCSSMQSACV